MTPTHGSQTLSFLNLVAETQACQILRQDWGDGLAIGFRGTDEGIRLFDNLFANYDPRPKGVWGVSPNAPKLSWLFETLAYVYLTEDRLLATLTLYFEVMIARELGRAVPERVGATSPEVAHTDFNEDCPHASLAHWTARALEFSTLPDEATDQEDQTWEVDEKLVAKLAIQAAVAFIEDHIAIRCFVPDAPEPLISHYSTGRHHDGDDQSFETLVDRAALA